jgi:hypothetical protein
VAAVQIASASHVSPHLVVSVIDFLEGARQPGDIALEQASGRGVTHALLGKLPAAGTEAGPKQRPAGELGLVDIVPDRLRGHVVEPDGAAAAALFGVRNVALCSEAWKSPASRRSKVPIRTPVYNNRHRDAADGLRRGVLDSGFASR